MFGFEKIIPVNTTYSFMHIRKLMLLVSSVVIIISLLLLIFKGLNLGIDFKGGTLIEVKTKNTNISDLRNILNPAFNDISLQEFGEVNTIIIRVQNNSTEENITTINKVKELINDKVIEFRRSEFV